MKKNLYLLTRIIKMASKTLFKTIAIGERLGGFLLNQLNRILAKG